MYYYGFLVKLLLVFQELEYLINTFFFFSAKKAVEKQEEKKTEQSKKKNKVLRVLDGKTSQNLCKWCQMFQVNM